jgi:hypothetical protein
MSYTPIGEGQIKELFKRAIFEVLQEQKEWFYDLFAEVIEDLALARAIREGETEETVDREEVFSV